MSETLTPAAALGETVREILRILELHGYDRTCRCPNCSRVPALIRATKINLLLLECDRLGLESPARPRRARDLSPAGAV